MNNDQPLAPPPLQPPDPKAVAVSQRASANTDPQPIGQLQPGMQYMAKHPSVNGQWQATRAVEHPTQPGRVLIEFADGTRYEAEDVEIGGPVAQNPSNTAGGDPVGQTAQTSPLNPDYETFRQILVQLNSQSRRMFGMPLEALTIMVRRLAVERESDGTGNMATYGGVPMFTPDQDTFNRWVEDYLMYVQAQEAGRGAE